jgi:hypothetical protein
MDRQEDILKEMDEWVSDEEKIKTLDKPTVNAMMDGWLSDFNLV